MQPQGALILLLGAAACLAGVGLVAFGLGTDSAAAQSDHLQDDEGGEAVEAPATPGTLPPAAGVFHPSDRAEVMEATPARRTDGVIRGDVTLAAASVGKFNSITIRIVEAMGDDSGRKPYTFQLTLPFDPRDGTPKFTYEGIPFSDYGYVVQAFAAGLNGTEQTVVVDEDHPVADVVLGIHPGVPFTILLRDQDLAPLGNVEVNLTPEAHPPGRQAYREVTDSFGAAVFRDVLRGPYQAHVGPMGQPLLPPQPIEVLANSGLQAQSKTIVVPKGESLTVNVYNAVGHGVTDIEVKLSSGSDVRYREIKKQTDWSGRVVFDHLPAGSYWVNVLDSRYQPRTVPAVVRAGTKPKDLDVHLRMR